MKTIKISIILASIVLLTSCGVNSSLIVNHNQNSTQVHLSSNNFKVIDKISGTAEVEYICGIGGLRKKHLYENAYSDMISKANLLNSSKAIINLVTEEHFGGVPPFYYKRTVTITANVIEFIK